MKRFSKPSDYIFQISWEVCNKVGGIYTVLSTHAKVMESIYKDNLIYIGPDLQPQDTNPLFEPDATLYPEIAKQAKAQGIDVRFGRWAVPGRPIVALVGFQSLFAHKDSIYSGMWNDFKVDSLHAYGDYDEACLFSYQAGRLISVAYRWFKANVKADATAVLQAHEWMSGFGLLYIKKQEPQIGTIFTTHATTVGRSITTNNKPLYAYFEGYFGDQMARELNVESKHSVEKAAALEATCLTTVSQATDRECRQFFGRESDVILPNGFDASFTSKGATLQAIRRRARKAVLNTYNALAATNLTDKTLIVSTSGRNDFRCKGFDIFLSALKRLEERYKMEREILAVIAVPAWKKQARQDLLDRLAQKPAIKLMDCSMMEPLSESFITHELHNFDSERIVEAIKQSGLSLSRKSKIHLMFIPSYLDGEDGVINLPYYDFLTASDYCVYPSYYEPWGYTPLESIAFGIPCMTTSLSGFGQWVNQVVGHQAILSDGVAVIPLSDNTLGQCADEIATSIQGMALLNENEARTFGEAARKLSLKALWKDFISNYIQAYTLALKKN